MDVVDSATTITVAISVNVNSGFNYQETVPLITLVTIITH